jgi:hypothetical protein
VIAASGPRASAKSCISPARISHAQASLSDSVSVRPAINAAKSIRVLSSQSANPGRVPHPVRHRTNVASYRSRLLDRLQEPLRRPFIGPSGGGPTTQDARLEGRASVVVLWMIAPLPAETYSLAHPWPPKAGWCRGVSAFSPLSRGAVCKQPDLSGAVREEIAGAAKGSSVGAPANRRWCWREGRKVP